MLISVVAPKPYAFLAAGSTGRRISAITAAIHADARAATLLADPQATIMSDVKLRLKASGSPVVKSLYWSVQRPNPQVWGGAEVRTLVAGEDGLIWCDWLDDPGLPGLRALPSEGKAWRLLRYIPERRATFWVGSSSGPARIVKVKRADRAHDAAHRLAVVNAALAQVKGVQVPRLLSPAQDGVFSLSICPGTVFGQGAWADARTILHRIGQVHGRLHNASPRGLPQDPHAPALKSLALIAALCPAVRPVLAQVADFLMDAPPPAAPVLCHGDLAPDQILSDGTTISLVDFDRAHAGDAAMDIARFLVALADQPLAGLDIATAQNSYLSGYAEMRPLPQTRRLQWCLAEVAVARLLVLLRKDLASPARVDRLVSMIRSQVAA